MCRTRCATAHVASSHILTVGRVRAEIRRHATRRCCQVSAARGTHRCNGARQEPLASGQLRLRGPRLGSRPSARKRDAHGGNARDAELAIDTVKLPSSPAQRGHAQHLRAKHNKGRDPAEMARARSPNKVESAVRLQRRRDARAQSSKVARFTARARGQPRRGAARRRSCLYFTFSDSFAKPQAL